MVVGSWVIPPGTRRNTSVHHWTLAQLLYSSISSMRLVKWAFFPSSRLGGKFTNQILGNCWVVLRAWTPMSQVFAMPMRGSSLVDLEPPVATSSLGLTGKRFGMRVTSPSSRTDMDSGFSDIAWNCVGECWSVWGEVVLWPGVTPLDRKENCEQLYQIYRLLDDLSESRHAGDALHWASSSGKTRCMSVFRFGLFSSDEKTKGETILGLHVLNLKISRGVLASWD